MAIRATPQGLEIVEDARKQKRWKRQDAAWYTTAAVSLATLRRFLAGTPVGEESFKAICKAVGIDNWQEITDFRSQQPESPVASNSTDLSAIDPNFVGRENLIASSSQSEPSSMGRKDTQGFPLPENLPSVKNWVSGSRSAELDILKTQILDPQTRTITITAVCVVGLAGIGKTTLASQLVHQLHSTNTPFVAAAWESLRSVTGKPPRFESIMDSLLLTLSNNEITPIITILDNYFKKTERLVKLLKDQPCLLVLDNVETVLKTKQAKRAGYFADDCTEYAWLFQKLAETEHQSKVIFTSRETLAQLQRRETHTLRLGGLDQEAAVKLLESFKLIATSEELAKLAKRYDGHPKALEIVAALIQDDVEFQGRVGKFLEDTKWLLINTLDELIEQVTNRLSNEELRCLSQISVYETPEHALSVAGIAVQMPEMSKRDVKENIIEALKRRQLLDYNRNNESYQMHPLVQEKASNLLSSESAYRTAHRQAYRYFLSIAKPEAEWKEFDDLKPLLRAHYHACQAQDWDEAAVAISRAYEYLRLKSYFYLLIDLYSKLIPTNWKSGEQLVTSSYIHCDALCRLGHAYHSVSQVKTADEYYQYSLIFAYKIRDRKRESIALTHIALNSIDNNQKAIDNLHKCLNIADEIQDYHLKYDALTYLGMLQGRFGNYHAQLEYFQKALEVADQNGLKREKAIAFSHVGCVYAKLGKYDIALEYNQQNLAVTIELENPKDEACARAILADIYNKLGRYETAINYAQSCLVIARKIGYKHCEKGVLSSMGISYRGLGDYQTSIKLFNQCLKLVIEIGDQSTEGNILCEIGINYRELGRIEASIENLQNSLIVFQKICNRADESRVLIELARSSYKTNFLPLKTIQNYLNQAEQICIELKLPLLTDVQKMKAELLENDR